MKGIVRLSVLVSFCITLAKADAGSKDEQPKQTNNNANAISLPQKPELLSYQQITHYTNGYQPEQVVYDQRYSSRTQHLQPATQYQHQQEQRNLVPQHQPTPVAMVIIAQPAYVPISMLQHGDVAQKLLNYFHGNMQRYQYYPNIRNHQQPQQYVPTPVQSQHVPQYAHYQQDVIPSAPAQTATQFLPHEALPTPQALVSQQIVPDYLHQQNIVEGRSLQYPTQQPQQIQYHHHHQPHQTNQQNDLQLQQVEQQSEYQKAQQQQSEYQKPQQLTDLSQIAQQAAQHFLSNGGLTSGSRTAPAIITGLELFPPEQQEKIKKQLGAHFGSPLQPLNFAGAQNQNEPKMHSSVKYHHEYKQRMKGEKFSPSIEVKDGEITQSIPSGGGKM